MFPDLPPGFRRRHDAWHRLPRTDRSGLGLCDRLQRKPCFYGYAFAQAHFARSNHTIISNVADTLSGDITLTAYINNGSANGSYSLQAQSLPTGISPTNFQRFSLGPATGIALIQDNAGTVTTLNTTISGVVFPAGVWLCLELRCHGTRISGG